MKQGTSLPVQMSKAAKF